VPLPKPTDELGGLVAGLLRPSALVELAAVAACLLLAWALTRAVHGARRRPGSIWLGDRAIDGVMFPVVALALAFAGRWALEQVLTVTVFRLVQPILLSLVAIRLTVRVLRVAYPDSPMMRVVERSVSWIAWLGVVLWITGLLPLVMDALDQVHWKIGSTRLSLRNLIEGGLSASVVLVIALWVSAAIEQRLLAGDIRNLSLRKIAANAVRATLLFVGLMLALSAAGIDLTALGVLGGAIGVGLGFGLQKLAANYVSGFVILAEQSVRIGDVVKVDNFEGRITDINTRYTVIRALDGRESIVPNEMLITARVENCSLADPRVLLSTKLQVAYGTPLDPLLPRLVAVVAAVPRVLAEPGPSVLLSSFAADGLELTVAFWIADPQNGTGNVRSDVNLAILRTLDAAGVEIPFPQRVVQMRATA
jgi:small-conductance mechanosensitive channel